MPGLRGLDNRLTVSCAEETAMLETSLRILVLAAHPDDAEFHVGGLLSIYGELGHCIRIVSVTNGAAGHHEMAGEVLAQRRRTEAEAAAARIGATFDAWVHPDGQLVSTLDIRFQVIREIRMFQPDLVLTHRPYDYHPDHRAVAQLVQDASYMVTVPPIAPETPILPRDPVVAYFPDLFTRPNPLRADIVVDVTAQMDRIVQLLACHESQVYEWMPFNQGVLDQVPDDKAGRMTWLRQWVEEFKAPFTKRYHDRIMDVYGTRAGAAIAYVEILEISEYARPLDAQEKQRLFPFVP
jgi:N-acetylglucosamine malate deacetylase 1